MIDLLRSLFGGGGEGGEEGPSAPGSAAGESGMNDEAVRLAACALLLELAHADQEFTDSEREHLEGTVRRQFGLDPDEAMELLEQAASERSGAVDLFQFTRLIDRSFTLSQKMVLAEAMWGLVYADGSLDSQEDHLVRKISNLLRLEAGYLSQARNRARSGGSDDDSDSG